MEISKKGLDFIKSFEGLHLNAYLCPSKVPTIGWGTTVYPDGSKVRIGDTCTKEQAEEYLNYDMKNKYEKYVESSVVFPLLKTQTQFDALVSFVYNVGKGGLHKPNSIDRRIKAGENLEVVIREELPRWNKGADGTVLPGLVRRRKEEVEMFFSEKANDDIKLYYGEVSNDVKLFQKMINIWLSTWNKEELAIDSVFGAKTLIAVKDFQDNNKLSNNGHVSQLCWTRVEKFYEEAIKNKPKKPDSGSDFFRWKRGENCTLSKNFKAIEFQCKCGSCLNQKIEKKLVRRLQELRESFDTGIFVNSGFRCSTHNKNVGGVPNSRHMEGDAADIRVPSFSPSKIAQEYEKLGYGNDSGIGIYNSFTHIDTRGYRARWGKRAIIRDSGGDGGQNKEENKRSKNMEKHKCRELEEAVLAIGELTGFIVKRAKDGVGYDDGVAVGKKLITDSEFRNKLNKAIKGIQNIPSELKEELSKDGLAGLASEGFELASKGVEEFTKEFYK